MASAKGGPASGGRQAGFSMVELLLTVVFVTLGSLMIQGTFMKAADVFGRYSHTLRAILWAEQCIARSREAVLRDEPAGAEAGVLQASGKDIQWTGETRPVDAGPDLYSILVSMFWTESGRPLNYKKELYVYQRDLSLQL